MARFQIQDVQRSINFAANKLGFEEVKDQQKSALTAFLEGRDVFCSLPTGFGKSFTFQAFNICYDYLLRACNEYVVPTFSLVIFPIKSLIEDQLARLKEKGVKAVYLDGSINADAILQGEYTLLFAAPEALVGGDCRGRDILLDERIRERVRGIFIDECHVVPKWGFADKDRKAFRQHYAQLADIRAMLSAKVPLMALTATATVETRKVVISNLAMYHVFIVEESPNRVNIKLVNVTLSQKDYEGTFTWLIEELKSKPDEAERVIIYCRTLQQCRDLYGLFFYELQSKKGDKLPFAMFHSESTHEVQLAVIDSFTKEDGHIRVLFSTVAFGMGVDVKGVHTIIHLGVPSDPASFLQESGRAGRDGKPSVSVLLTYPGVYADSRDVDPSMKEYIKNKTVCRRQMMLKHFGHEDHSIVNTHTCCDICELHCKCDDGVCTNTSFAAEKQLKELDLAAELDISSLPRRSISMDTMCDLNQKLSLLRLSQLSLTCPHASNFLAGVDIVSGIPSETIDKIVLEANIVFTFEQFKERYAIYSDYVDVWNILSDTVGCCPIQAESVIDNVPNMEAEEETDDIDDNGFLFICDEEQYGDDILNNSEFATAHSTVSSEDEY